MREITEESLHSRFSAHLLSERRGLSVKILASSTELLLSIRSCGGRQPRADIGSRAGKLVDGRPASTMTVNEEQGLLATTVELREKPEHDENRSELDDLCREIAWQH